MNIFRCGSLQTVGGKTALGVILTFGLAQLALVAAPLSVKVLEKGPHHQRIETVTTELDELGQTVFLTNRYTEIASGLHVFTQGDWYPAKAEFAVFPDAVVADQVQFPLRLGANANSPDAVQLWLPDGQSRLRSQVLALQYWDAASGQSAPLGFIQDAQAELVSETQVVYPQALDGLNAALLYEIDLDHVEQNLVLLERLPEPETLGLRSASTRVELWTELFDFPPPQITRRVVRQETDPARRAQMAEPDVTDDFLDFGSMQIPWGGRAFLVDGPDPDPHF